MNFHGDGRTDCAWRWWKCVSTGRDLALAVVLLGGSLTGLRGEPTTNSTAAVDLKLRDYLQQVVQQNESVKAQALETEINRRKARSEYGAFEPQLETSYLREGNKRTNDIQQAAQQNGQGFFSERNSIYDGGIEALIPTGGKVRIGATMSDLVNNISPSVFLVSTNQPFFQQYQAFWGATFTQPLLKDAGFGATLAPLRLAALDSDIAFQQYRRQLMLTVYQAEGAYWNLFFAQEQVRFFDQSVSVAQDVLDDSRQKVRAGQGAELEVLEAQSALALRNTKRNDAVQNYYDALGHLQVLTGTAPDPSRAGSGSPPYRAADNPRTTNAPPSYGDGFVVAMASNPDFLIQQIKINEERVRFGIAKNQLLPELDLKAAYGFNGLGANPSDAWAVADTGDFPSWSVGVQFTLPLGGNIKGRNQYKAAQLSLQEADLNLKGIQTQIGNSLSISIQKASAWRQSITNYETVERYNEELLQTELARLKAGTVEPHKVLEVEAELLDSRQELAGALTRYRNALLEIELTDGVILQNRGLDVTRQGLRHQAEAEIGRRYPSSSEPAPRNSIFPAEPSGAE